MAKNRRVRRSKFKRKSSLGEFRKYAYVKPREHEMTDERSLYLVSPSAENLAEILAFDDREIMLIMPMYGMMKMFENNMQNPLGRYGQGPYRMPKVSFLQWIAEICGRDYAWPYLLRGKGMDNIYYSIPLVRGMVATDLANLVGLSLENVREFLANHLTFSQSTDEPTQQS